MFDINYFQNSEDKVSMKYLKCKNHTKMCTHENKAIYSSTCNYSQWENSRLTTQDVLHQLDILYWGINMGRVHAYFPHSAKNKQAL